MKALLHAMYVLAFSAVFIRVGEITKTGEVKPALLVTKTYKNF